MAGTPPSATPAPPPAPFEVEDLQEDQGLARPAPSGPTPKAPSEAGQGPLSGDLLTAFLSGLGAGDPSQVQDPDVFLREAGALLRALTTGLTATMMARAQFKSELRLGVTTIRRTENNPFKFSVSPEEALERLLLRPNPAYLPPLEAARGAFEDIQAHEMAMIAGLRAALRALLARFEPSALEARLDAASGLDRLLPMTRKSRYWDLFTETYGQVAADAAEDFMQLFGEAFTHAYEDQVLRLAQARGRRPT
jgi:type VI secretion system FHA domain protein